MIRSRPASPPAPSRPRRVAGASLLLVAALVAEAMPAEREEPAPPPAAVASPPPAGGPAGSAAAPGARPAPREEPPGTQHRVVGKGPGGCDLQIAAGPGSILDRDELILKDYVDIQCGEMRLQADLVRYVPSTHEAHAEGNVVLDQGPTRISAESIDYNLQDSTGTFLTARGYAEPTILFDAARIEQTSKDTLVLYDASFTACNQPVPYWSFKLKRGVLKLGSYAYLHDLSFKVGHATVFYTPYLVWPIKTDRASGLLFPEFGFSRRSGTVLSDAWYWAMGRSMDSTYYLDYMSKAGLGTGVEYRYEPSASARGMFTGYYIRDQIAKEENRPGVGVDRWLIDYNHAQDLTPEWRLVANANFVSDFDYFLDFERDIRLSSNPQAISKVYLTRNWGFYSLNMWTERRELLVTDPVDPLVETPITRWIEPQIEFRSRRQRLGDWPLYLTLESSADGFDKGTPDGRYQRIDGNPVLSSKLSPLPWLDVDAQVGVRGTYWSKSQRTDATGNAFIVDDSFERRIYQAGMTIIGPQFDRVFDTPGSSFSPQYKNTLEPTLKYTYLSAVDHPEEIIPFDALDIVVGNTNTVTYGFTTRLYAKRPAVGAEQLAAEGFPSSSGQPSFQQQLSRALLRESQDRSREGPEGAGYVGDEGGAAAEEPAGNGGSGAEAGAAGPAGAAGALPSEATPTSAGETAATEGGPATPAPGPAAGTGAAKPKQLSTVEIASLQITQDYSFLSPLSASLALHESRPVSPISGTLRINPSLNASIDLRTQFDVLFHDIREASLSANLRKPGLGFLDLNWTIERDLEGKAENAQGLSPIQPFDQSQVGIQGEASLFARHVLVGFQANYELGDIVPGQPRLRDQRYRAGYNTQCCGFQFEYLDRNFLGSDLREFRFLVNLKGVGNVIDLHDRAVGGAP